MNKSTLSPTVKVRSFYAQRQAKDGKGIAAEARTSDLALGIRENTRMTVAVGEELFSQEPNIFRLA